MIYSDGNIFLLQTYNTSYMFRKIKSGHLEHLHYGSSLLSKEAYKKALSGGGLKEAFLAGHDGIISMAEAIAPKHYFGGGNMNAYSDEHSDVFLEMLGLEISSFGKGDIREPFVEVSYADGNTTCDFLFDGFEIRDGKRLRAQAKNRINTKKALKIGIEAEIKLANLLMYSNK